jgi:membrane-bound ClpP family serine protease
MAYTMPLICLAMIPIHLKVPCQVSGLLGVAGLIPLVLSLIFAFMDKKREGRLIPVLLTFMAFIANTMGVH